MPILPYLLTFPMEPVADVAVPYNPHSVSSHKRNDIMSQSQPSTHFLTSHLPKADLMTALHQLQAQGVVIPIFFFFC